MAIPLIDRYHLIGLLNPNLNARPSRPVDWESDPFVVSNGSTDVPKSHFNRLDHLKWCVCLIGIVALIPGPLPGYLSNAQLLNTTPSVLPLVA